MSKLFSIIIAMCVYSNSLLANTCRNNFELPKNFQIIHDSFAKELLKYDGKKIKLFIVPLEVSGTEYVKLYKSEFGGNWTRKPILVGGYYHKIEKQDIDPSTVEKVRFKDDNGTVIKGYKTESYQEITGILKITDEARDPELYNIPSELRFNIVDNNGNLITELGKDFINYARTYEVKHALFIEVEEGSRIKRFFKSIFSSN